MNDERKAPPADLRARTLQFSLRILRLCSSIPLTPEGKIARNQLARSGTSPGAQYREAHRARSNAEFVSKMESATQELDETAYWLELIELAGLVTSKRLIAIRAECDELIAIFTSSVITAKKKR